MRAGRKRKPATKRHPCGQPVDRPRAAVEAETRAPAIWGRVNHGIAPADACNENYGYPIGRLRLIGIAAEKRKDDAEQSGGISERQFLAAATYAKIVHREAGIMGIPMPWPKAMDPTGIGGQSLRKHPDEHTVMDARREFRNCRSQLLWAGSEIGVGSRVNQITYAVVIEQVDEGGLTADQLGLLRVGLNALAKLFK